MHATPSFSLAAWLHALDQPSACARDELLLGGTGHLLLTPDEEENVATQLREGVLPRLFESAQSRPVCVLTGLAPGADLLFTRVVTDWLHAAGIAHRTVGLLPLPKELLLEDWVLVAEANGNLSTADVDRQRDRLAQTLQECSSVIDLLPSLSDSKRLQSAAFRQSQYRRLAACLAQRSDILVAILRREIPNRPGGTAEVVDWRRNPLKVPPDCSTLLSTMDSKNYKRRLLLIDPESLDERTEAAPVPRPGTVQSFAARASDAMQAGNYVHCYDLTQQAKARGFDSSRLQYLALLALANAGSSALAWRRYNELGLRGDERDEDWLALKGRLLKDLALAGLPINPLHRGGFDSRAGEISRGFDDEHAAYGFMRAAQAYLAAHRLTGGHFTAINAATMYQLAGDGARARQLALEVLTTLAEPSLESGSDETGLYYRFVTEAEACLLIGDLDRYRTSLAQADPLMRSNFNARSRTRAQLQTLCAALQIDERLPALLSLPEVIRIRRRGDWDHNATLPAHCPGALVFIVLERAADLDAAEQLQKNGAHLHIVLPNERGNMLEIWSANFGAVAATRLQALLEQAGDVTVARGFLNSEARWSQDYVAALADGLAVLDARRLGCQVRELFLDDDTEGFHIAENLIPGQTLSPATEQRRFAGLIFADIVGFRRLHDEDLPRFWEVVMGSIARIVERFGKRVLFRGTWGDALHLVTEDAVTAAEIAIAIQTRFEELRATETGGLADIELRLAAHYAPVFAGHDPIVDATMYYGSQLAFTARIEPITPPGMIFVTELFAARVMLDAAHRFHLEYVGELALAKLYGSYRIFSLRTVERRQPGRPLSADNLVVVS